MVQCKLTNHTTGEIAEFVCEYTRIYTKVVEVMGNLCWSNLDNCQLDIDSGEPEADG